MAYEVRTWNLSLHGISTEQLEQHFALYKGYVTNTNTLNRQLEEMRGTEQLGTSTYAEIKRRLGFEYNGMRLHEYYFDNLGASEISTAAKEKLSAAFSSYDLWERDFRSTGMMRGIGWAILYQDSTNGALQNCWITDHELGHPAGFQPILVMDVWEHAYTVDWKPTERKLYVDAFLANVNWQAVTDRLH